MSSKWRLTALLLVLAMLLTMLAACGSSSSDTEETEETAEETAEEEEEDDGLKPGDIGYDWSSYGPLTEETETLTMFYTQPPMLSTVMDTPNDMSVVYQQFEEITNVHIEFEMHNMMSADTDFTLMVAGGDLPDIINDALGYYTSADQAYEDGVAIDVLEYLDEMPNLSYWLDLYPEILSDRKTDSGLLLNVPRINYPEEPAADAGLMIRQDWLDELGLEIPTTYDAFYDVLVAFKTEYDISDPYVMPYEGLSPWGLMAGGYGLTLTADANNFYIADGEVALATISDEFYDWLCMMHQWYEEGLISSDFTSYTEDLPDETLITNSQAGIWFTDMSYIKTYEELLADAVPEAVVNIMGDIGMDEDYSGYIEQYDSISESGGFSVSEDCENPLLAFQWIDLWYDPDLTQFINYGFEGQTFNYDEDGEPHLSELLTDNEYGLGIKLICGVYMVTSGSFVYDYSKYLDDYTDLQMEAFDVWVVEAADPSTVTTAELPNVSVSTDESTIVTSVMSDVTTYVAEMTLKFITGATELTEESYADYVDVIIGMGAEDAIEAMQDAYERYLER